MRLAAVVTMLALGASQAGAQPLRPELAGLGFLVGHWSGGRGQVADTGGTSTGSSSIEIVANGSALLRRDHTQLFNADGHPTGAFDQIMMIYPDAGAILADYLDGDHVINYTSAVVVPGKAVTFASTASSGAPTFRLGYTLSSPNSLSVLFSMALPGSAAFHPIAAGTLTKDR